METITIPTTPPKALLISMAMRMRHDFGLPKYPGQFSGMTNREREVLLGEMAQLYEEIAGKGFYKWDGSKDGLYAQITQ